MVMKGLNEKSEMLLYVKPVYPNEFQPPLAILDNNILLPNFQKAKNPKRSHTSCVVRGALALALRVSRLVGLAPLRMTHVCKRGHDAFVVSYSQYAAVYSWMLMLVLHTVLITGLVIDLTLDPAVAIRTRAPTACVVWALELFNLILLVTFGVYSAPARVKDMVDWLNIIEKVRLKPANSPLQNREEKKQCIFIIGLLVTLVFASSGDFSTFLREALDEDRAWRVVCIYCTFYMEYVILIVMQLQFIFVALHLHVALKSANECLRDLVVVTDVDRAYKSLLKEVDPPIFSIKPTHHVMGPFTKAKSKTQAHKTTNETKVSLTRIMHTYSTICDVIRKVDQSYARVLVCLVGSCFLHLVITPYYFVTFLYSNNQINIIEVFFQVAYMILHPLFLVIIVEPGHRTDCEFDRTAMLVNQLLRQSGPHGPLTAELDMFYKQLQLNRVQYTPMGVCTLTRPLIASICGGVTTYLVIILQIQNVDSERW